ncbi:hypothetical protein M0802_003463 [Mischocyttarus mexicanus]|nr:hypothetical protein M0802_003463 [Mischocyttarus mexicanus]
MEDRNKKMLCIVEQEYLHALRRRRSNNSKIAAVKQQRQQQQQQQQQKSTERGAVDDCSSETVLDSHLSRSSWLRLRRVNESE